MQCQQSLQWLQLLVRDTAIVGSIHIWVTTIFLHMEAVLNKTRQGFSTYIMFNILQTAALYRLFL
jgi:hypothetical protein